MLDTEQIKKMSKGLFIYLAGYFDGYCQILELFPPFGRKKFWYNILSRSLNLIMNGVGGAKRTVYLFKRPGREKAWREEPIEGY